MHRTIFNELALEWVNSRKPYIKESTYATYFSHVEIHIIPEFKGLYCDEITESKLQMRVIKWIDDGLSDKTVRDIVMILNCCIRYGNKRECMRLENYKIEFPPKRHIGKIKTYTLEEQAKIVNAIYENLNYKSLGVLICIYTGIRIGELCALKWSDIDFEHSLISIKRTLQRIYVREETDICARGYTKIIISTPKTFSGVRDIPLSKKITYTLKDMCPEDKETYLLTGSRKFTEPRTYRNYYKKFILGTNIIPLKFHSLRHTFATRCIEAGADYKTVSELLGHSSVNITLNLYVHPTLRQKRECVEMIDNLLP